jgi:hypothetical protein
MLLKEVIAFQLEINASFPPDIWFIYCVFEFQAPYDSRYCHVYYHTHEFTYISFPLINFTEFPVFTGREGKSMSSSIRWHWSHLQQFLRINVIYNDKLRPKTRRILYAKETSLLTKYSSYISFCIYLQHFYLFKKLLSHVSTAFQQNTIYAIIVCTKPGIQWPFLFKFTKLWNRITNLSNAKRVSA